MKILPSDDLSHKLDYNRDYKKYFKEELIDKVNTQKTKALSFPLLKAFLHRSIINSRMFKI